MASQTQLIPRMAQCETATRSTFDKSFNMRSALLVAAIENSAFGLIIVSQNGSILHKNKRAQALLQEISYSSSTPIPERLWYSCQNLLKSRGDSSEIFPEDYTIVLEDEIITEQKTIHMWAQWFDWDNSSHQSDSCFLITLEDRQQSLMAVANQEAQRYGLTTRETDVWGLKRIGDSYKEIANKLYISENTVKKHLKNIYAKKEQFAWSV